MSVHSQPAATQQAAHPEFPRHVVTAVLVSHDGERWLPEVLSGLLGQERPVQDVIAADTGSADASATLVAEAIGADRVLHLARRSGFGSAVAEAARTAPVLTPEELPYLKRRSAWDPVTRTWDTSTYDLPELPFGEPVQWLWLLHDDAAPEPDALAELLRQADATPSAAIIGAKLRGWYDRKQLLEVGVSIANSGRRWTGLDRREQDQGQHDQVRAVLSVSTAGMLVRRDVFEQLGGFDRRLPLMRDDLDLCWRAQAAGHRVLVAPQAVLRHAEAASRERRSIDCAGRLGGNPHRVDKAAAAYTLLVNARGRALPWIVFRLVLGTLLRVLAYLVGKLPGRAVDEAAGLLGTLLRPGLVLTARRRRERAAAGGDPGDLRPLFPPPLATVRTTLEQAAGGLARRSETATAPAGRHGAVESGPSDDEADSLEVEQFARLRRLFRRPGPLLFLGLLLAALVACRDLIGTGALSGGALLPAPDDAGALWDRHFGTWQPIGTGGTESAPPYLAFLALLATGLLGSTGLTMTLALVACVPLAGLSAYFTSRPLVMSRVLRAWAAVAYAFLPAVTGALAGGHLGTAVLAVLLPPLARTAVLAAGYATPGGRGSWRATWACALLLTVATAFTPVMWPLAVLLALLALALPLPFDPALVRAKALRTAAVLLTPFVLLGPWSWSVLLSPGDFLREVGLPFDTGDATAFQLLNLNPGGPGTPGTWLLIGIVLAALGALLRGERRLAVTTAWAVALVAFVFAVWSDGEGWAGPATLVNGIALLSAAVLGADGARYRVAAQSFGWRQPVAVAIAGAAAAGPLLVAAGWVIGGADGPLERTSPVQVPAFVAEESRGQDQARTLVLAGRDAVADGSAAAVDYSLVRGSGARLGDADLAELLGPDDGLSRVVGDLVAGSGADQTTALAAFGVRYVLVQDGSPPGLQRVLDTTPGLQRLSQEEGALWRVDREVARAMIVPAEEQGGAAAAVAVPAGAVEIHTDVPNGEAGRVLRLADAASDGWRATLDGQELPAVTVGGWAQGFELPAGGGRLDVVHEAPFTHTLWTWAQGFGLLVLTVLALPGRRRELDDDLPDEPEPEAAPQGRRARRQSAAPPARAHAAQRAGEPAAPGAEPQDGPDESVGPDGPPAPAPGVPPQAAPYAAAPPGPAEPGGGSWGGDPDAWPGPYQEAGGYQGTGGYQEAGGYQDQGAYPGHDQGSWPGQGAYQGQGAPHEGAAPGQVPPQQYPAWDGRTHDQAGQPYDHRTDRGDGSNQR
ncbi:glycosyltransferase [Streptomyces marincola]|uniref:glycosyltransferase n=1 Tax=Streptomyces marincola TaxID=2878388 RepID=UPI001CF27B5A|nr:glycosyltransferase [Streptomyces marincola]UCM88397.1 glycosyltransferase family 2 protein [Streptomyces marincola]